MMRNQLEWKCGEHGSQSDCPDAVITRTNKGFGLIIHDGGSSFIAIDYCPWCGMELAKD